MSEASSIVPPPTDTEPKEKPRLYATWGLLAAILLVYGFTTDGLQVVKEASFRSLALIPELVSQGEYWRLVTANFLHADWHHLLNNCFGILVFGQLLEPLLGPRRMLGLYLSSGLGAMAVSLMFLPFPTLGASGIDYGLIGCYIGLVVMVHRRLGIGFAGALRTALVYIGVFLLWNLTEIQHVNLWGHFGGLLVGLQFGVLTGKRLAIEVS